MMSDLNQFEIDQLTDQEYAMYLAYGESQQSPVAKTIRSGGRGNRLRQAKTTRIYKKTGTKILRFGERIRGSLDKGSFTSFS